MPILVSDADATGTRREEGPPRYGLPSDLDPEGKVPPLSVGAARRLARDIRYWLISIGKDEDLP